MANKRDYKRALARLQRVKTWQLVILLLLVTLIAASFLRLNNLGMIERREAVMAADEKGDEAKIKSALLELQDYVSSHMNTDLGNGVYLVKSYERDRAAALKAAQTGDNPRAEVYQEAAIDCRSRFVGGVESFRNDYVQCVIARVSALESQSLPSLNLPPANLYRYDFASPLISFDLAGLTVLLGLIILLAIIVRGLAALLLRLLLKRHFSSV